MSIRHHPRPPASASRSGERGVIVPMAALSMVTVILVMMLVIDGSHAYPQRRNMQNAADASSLAGARALDKVKFAGQAWSTVDATVQSVAADNGAEAAECTVITGTGATLGTCNDPAVVTGVAAAGVRVRTTDVRTTSFGSLTDQDTVTARASAAATIQTFVGGTGSPFIVCGNPAIDGWPILGADGRVDPVSAAAIGPIDLQAAQMRGCGAGAAFKGKIDANAMLGALPADIVGENGNGFNSNIRVQVLGSNPCSADDIDKIGANQSVSCDIVLPIADSGSGNGNQITMHAVGWAIFHVSGNGSGNPKYWGEFVGSNAYVSGGLTSTAVPTNGSTPRVIRLIF